MNDRDYIDAEYRVIVPDEPPPAFTGDAIRERTLAACNIAAVLTVVPIFYWIHKHAVAWITAWVNG